MSTAGTRTEAPAMTKRQRDILLQLVAAEWRAYDELRAKTRYPEDQEHLAYQRELEGCREALNALEVAR